MNPQQKFEMQMGMLKPEYQERFFKELHEFFNDTPFPAEHIPANFDNLRFAAMVHRHNTEMEISANTFNELLFSTSFEEYNLGNMVTICNASERTTFMDWIILYGFSEESKKNYAYFLESMEQLTIHVNAMIEPKKDALLRKMSALQKIPVPNQSPKTIHMPS